MPLKPVDTAIRVILGPIIDDTDFKTREESITYDQAGIEIDVILEKSDGTITTTAVTPTTGDDHDLVHTDQGYYSLEIPASAGDYNNNALGTLHVVGYATGVLPFRSPTYDIVPAMVFNSLVAGSDYLEVDVLEVIGDSGVTNNMQTVFSSDFSSNYDSVNLMWITNVYRWSDSVVAVGGSNDYPMVDVVAVNDSTNAATSMKIVFDTDFATNYDTTNDKWQTEADVLAISGDTTAADNLELQYDTTGVIGDPFPATQAQIGNLTSGTAAINTTAESFTKVASEPETNTYAATVQADETYHIVEDNVGNGVTDCYYEFDVGGNGIPVSITWLGYCQGVTDEYFLYAYDWDGTAWQQIGSSDAAAGSTPTTVTYDLTTAHVGNDGADLGKVRFRIYSTDGSLFATDRLLCSYAVVSRSVGYAEGAVWVDSAGAAGSESYVNGTADNPCPWANALTVADNMKLKRFHIANDVTVTLGAAFEDQTMYGEHYLLDLNTNSINESYFTGATITGIGSATGHAIFMDCEIGAATIPPCRMTRCGIGFAAGTFTAASDGDYTFIDCYSLVPGSGSPVFAFSGLGSTTGINNRRWSGGSTWTLDGDCTLSQEVVTGGGQTFTTGGANVELRGIFRSATFTLSNAGTVQIVGVTGPVTLSGSATTTVNIYGVTSSLSDSSSGTTVTDNTTSQGNMSDYLLNRDMAAVAITNARSPLNALRMLRNKWTVVTSTLTVYEEDDSTPAWTSTLTADAAADPVVTSDPA